MTPGGSDRGDTAQVVRVFWSHRFRLVIAAALTLVGSWVNLRYYEAANGPWLFDFEAYLLAANHFVGTGTPYAAPMLEAPVDAVCDGCYLYPPQLAQALILLTYIPPVVAKLVWFLAIEAAAVASIWLATGIGGAQRSLERLLWSIAATLWFTPVFHANYFGNVGSIVALMVTLVAMGGVAAGIASGLGLFLKVSPGALVPAAVTQGWQSRRAVAATIAAVMVISLIASPQAWLDYATVLPNMLRGATAYPFNLAPANSASEAGLPGMVVSAVRLLTIIAGILGIILSVWLARRPRGMPAAALAGTIAMLLIPSTLWPHYLVVLLPFAAIAWPIASVWLRTFLFTGAVIVSVTAQGWIDGWPYLGILMMLGASAWVLWPHRLVALDVD